ncbi:MAG: DUF1194 domain-containing protein [Rhodobacteraceae bacterium]|nr:DUF1194 domain-containing protein [Paracoccaceae bacterium]
MPAARLALLALLCLTPPARGCEVALLLAMDVSGSVDAGEYGVQVEGLVAGLRDGAVRDALVLGQAALAVLQWSGPNQQRLSIPWRPMTDERAIAAIAAEAGAMARAFHSSGTAPGNAIAAGLEALARGPDCGRRVIDISGDGDQNSGIATAGARGRAEAAGVTINAVAIEDPGLGQPVTEFYRRHAITRGGFVMTARGHRDYAATLRAKLLRELVAPAM